MPENKTAANLGRSLKKIHSICLWYSNGATLLLTQLSVSPSPRRPTQLLQVHLQGVSTTPKMWLMVGKKLPPMKISFSLGPVSVFLGRVGIERAWSILVPPWDPSRGATDPLQVVLGCGSGPSKPLASLCTCKDLQARSSKLHWICSS